MQNITEMKHKKSQSLLHLGQVAQASLSLPPACVKCKLFALAITQASSCQNQRSCMWEI